MVEILKVILFGLVEGVTEWLPISSTGHMILLNEFVTLDVSEGFWNMFLVVVQLGAVVAAVILFWKKIFPFQFSDKRKPVVEKNIFILWGKVLIACIPAGIVGVLFDDTIDKYLYKPLVVAAALIIFGVAFILVENWNKGRKPKVNSLDEITCKTALLIGLFQLIAAVLPGTSRSGATIVGALLLGISRTTSAEFTFILAVPTMLGASLLKLVKGGFAYSSTEYLILLLGMVTAFVVSMIVIKFLMNFIKKHDFKVFGWYRIVLGILVICYFAFLK